MTARVIIIDGGLTTAAIALALTRANVEVVADVIPTDIAPRGLRGLIDLGPPPPYCEPRRKAQWKAETRGRLRR